MGSWRISDCSSSRRALHGFLFDISLHEKLFSSRGDLHRRPVFPHVNACKRDKYQPLPPEQGHARLAQISGSFEEKGTLNKVVDGIALVVKLSQEKSMPKRKDGGPKSDSLYAQLMSATARGDEKVLEGLIPRAKAEGTLTDNLLRIGLQNACKKGKSAAVRLLLAEGAPTDLTGEKGSPALFWSVTSPQTKGHEEVTKMLLSKEFKHTPADPEWKDENGRTIFMAAAWRGHNHALKCLLDQGARYNTQDAEGRTVLHNLAVDKRRRWNAETISIILDRDIDVDCKDGRSRTALHWAVATGKPNLVAQLVTRRSYKTPDLNAQEKRGKTALHLACRAKPAFPSIVEILLEAGADPQLASDGQWTCLHNSAKKQHQEEIVELILRQCPSMVNVKTSTGMTPLHVAAQFGNGFAVMQLLQSPAIKLNQKDAFYMTPM